MKKTLLLVFIHGFKGGDDTFGDFPAHLRASLSNALPKVDVVAVTYPRFETRGDLNSAVARFRECADVRLQNQVIDIEVANQTPSPTVDPSVHTVLLGHSMGGVMGAETLILLASEQLIPPPDHLSSSNPGDDNHGQEGKRFMFPRIQGLVAFDTPFLGVAPGVVSYAAENHHKTVTAAYDTLSDVANVFGWGSDKKNPESDPRNRNKNEGSPPSAQQPPSAGGNGNPSSPSVDVAATPSWQRWGRYAMFAGAAGAAAAGGAAALYSQRDRFSAGWSWATSHLEFVGCLARGEELHRRVSTLSRLQEERGIGCANFYTCLGEGAVNVSGTAGSQMNATAGATSFGRLRTDIRTFCSLPGDVKRNLTSDTISPFANNFKGSDNTIATEMSWVKSMNDKATDETKAHMSMFLPKDNPGYYELANKTQDLLVRWIDKGWYETSEDHTPGHDSHPDDEGNTSGDFMDANDMVVVS